MPDNHRKMALVARTPSVPDLNRIQVERRQAPAASSRTSATPRASPTGDSENDDEDGEDGQDDDDGEDTLTNNSSSSSSTTTTTTPPASSSSSSSISTTTTPPASSSSACVLFCSIPLCMHAQYTTDSCFSVFATAEHHWPPSWLHPPLLRLLYATVKPEQRIWTRALTFRARTPPVRSRCSPLCSGCKVLMSLLSAAMMTSEAVETGTFEASSLPCQAGNRN